MTLGQTLSSLVSTLYDKCLIGKKRKKNSQGNIATTWVSIVPYWHALTHSIGNTTLNHMTS